MPKVIKRRRPNLPDIDLDKPLSSKFLFALKSLDSGAIITKVAIDGDSLVVGTQTGKILIFDKRTLKSIESYQAHDSSINDIWVLHKRAIVSTSAKDKFIYLKCLSADFEDQQVNLGVKGVEEYKCITVIDNLVSPLELTCAVGTKSGKLLLY